MVDKELAAWEITLKSLRELREALQGLRMKVKDMTGGKMKFISKD